MITRNNYEEYFLLYVDNELSPADRLAVESFVRENPDLKDEWELLLQCRVDADDLPAFPNSNELLRSESSAEITLSGYESWLLSYIDGELDPHASAQVEAFIQQHPGMEPELRRLRQTVLMPDLSVTFPGKDSLYRKEEKRRIAWLPFARIAAAALVLGAVGIMVLRTSTSHTAGNSGVARITPAEQKIKDSDIAVTRQPVSPLHIQKAQQPSTPGVAGTVKDLATSSHPQATAIAPKASVSNNSRSVAPGRAPAAASHIPPAQVALQKVTPPDNDPVGQPDPNTPLVAVDMPKTAGPGSDPLTRTGIGQPRTGAGQAQRGGDPVAKTADNPASGAASPPATTVATGSFATQELLSHSIAYAEDEVAIAAASQKKNKLRGLFRKVTRALEKPASRAEDEDRKVLIGGFQIALQ